MSSPSPLAPETFPEFFRALWSHDPFPWQMDFANRVCAGQTPDYVTVPTGSGKTACLDATVFAMAVQASLPVAERTVGRRIFFIVNRRIIVDEAFDRAKKHLSPALADPDKYLANREAKKEPQKRLSDADLAKASAILRCVADALRSLGGELPLMCAELRGGIYRDRAWAKSLIQPMILCSTIDQAGSRLLFRGYGVSAEARPIHAALVAQDSFLMIDEAHISLPFLQTLDWVQRYRAHEPQGTQRVILPFSIVRMTATPPNDDKGTKLELSGKDREHPILKQRLASPKNARLVPAPRAKGKNWMDELAKVLETEASTIISNQALRSIAIMVNRVATARAVEALLRKKHPAAEVTLLLGRMRPLDRDRVTTKLQTILKTGADQTPDAKLQIVVSTQCLEVGADFDFDALVTECASLDALRQRFGRLNRAGREITAHAVIVLPEEQRIEESKLTDEKPVDPIYGNATPRTWRWLEAHAVDGCVDFGLNAMTAAVQAARTADEVVFDRLLMPRADAPVLLPAYLDCWVQTNPTPAADPDVALFLHGPKRDMAEVQVCWRADLPESAGDDGQQWKDTLALCPPTTLECLPVPLHLMRQWLEKGSEMAADTTGDAPASPPPEEDSKRKDQTSDVTVLIWEGAEKGGLVQRPAAIRPGQTVVLRTQDGGWDKLGHVPMVESTNTASIDRAEEGQAKLLRRAFVRLHSDVWSVGEENSAGWQLMEWAKNVEFDWRSKSADVREALLAVVETLADTGYLHARLHHLAKHAGKIEVEPYPEGSGVVLSVRPLLPLDIGGEVDSPDDGPDDPLLEQSQKQSLVAHTTHVTALARLYAETLGLASFIDAVTRAARLHDLGKVDPRFQAMLIQSDISAAAAQPVLWAKSDRIPNSASARQRARQRAGLPEGFRHEMLSFQLASSPAASSLLPESYDRKLLALHLIASHHGHARPFAPVVADEDPPSLTFSADDLSLSLSKDDRSLIPPHVFDSGIAARFWQLTNLHGWWGLALLEAVLRLADQTASANSQPTSAK